MLEPIFTCWCMGMMLKHGSTWLCSLLFFKCIMCRFTCPSMTNQLCFLLFWSRQQMGIRRLFFVPLDLGHLGPNSFMPTLQLHFCPFWITHMLRCQLISLFNRLHLSMSCWRICIFFTLRRWVYYFLLIFTFKKSHFTEKNQWHLLQLIEIWVSKW